MRDELMERAAGAVELAKKRGAQGVWASAQRSRSVAYRVRDGKLEEVNDSTARGLSLKLYVDGRYSAHSTTDLLPDRLEKFVTEAVALTRALEPDRFRALPEKHLFDRRPDAGALELYDGKITELSGERRLELAERMYARVAGAEKLISATGEFSDEHFQVAAASSNGFAGSYQCTTGGLSLNCTLDDGERRPEEWMGAWGRHLAPLPEPEVIADEALRLARARLGAKKGEARRTAMVVDARAAGMLVQRLLAPARAGAVQQERSFWRGKLGKKVVSPRLNVSDELALPRALMTRPFDDEGISARRLAIIEKGVFKNLYVDTYYGKKLGMEPTTGAPSNVVVTPGTRARDAIVADAGDGVLVTSWLGGNMDPTTGDFSFGIRGHVIKRGKLGAPVGEMNVTGNVVELFSRLEEVGNDPWLYAPVRAPSLHFSGVQFS